MNPLHPIPELIAELAAGQMIVLLDDESRENEGDLILAAEHVSPAAINFMVTQARGLVCLALTPERCVELDLSPMVARNTASHGTAFTVTIDAAQGISTGTSAADRAHTIRCALDPAARPEDFARPGHVFPLVARAGGVRERPGHTEAACDLARLAGCAPAAVICEIMNPDGSMARLPQLREYADRFHLKMGTIAGLLDYLHVLPQDRGRTNPVRPAAQPQLLR